MKKIILSVAVIALAFTACKKDETTTPVVNTTPTSKDASGSTEITAATNLAIANEGVSSLSGDSVTILKDAVAGTTTKIIRDKEGNEIRTIIDANGVATSQIDDITIVGKIQTDGSIKGSQTTESGSATFVLYADNAYNLAQNETVSYTDSNEVTTKFTIYTSMDRKNDGSSIEVLKINGVKIIESLTDKLGVQNHTAYNNGTIVLKATDTPKEGGGHTTIYKDANGKVITKEAADLILATIPNAFVLFD